MLPDPDAQRRERVLLAFRYHHARLPAVEGGSQRTPVPGFHRVGVRPGLLREVLAPEVYLRARSPDLPGRERELQGLLQRQAAGVQVVMEGAGDRRGFEGGRDLPDLSNGPDPLVVLERQVAEHLLLGAHGIDEAPGRCGLAILRSAQVEHEHGVAAAEKERRRAEERSSAMLLSTTSGLRLDGWMYWPG